MIANTGPFHFSAWREFFEARGKVYSEQDFQHDFGRRNDDILKTLPESLTTEQIETLAREKEAIFRSKIKNDVSLLPGVLRLLKAQQGMNAGIALASSAPSENIHFILSSLRIAEYFDCVASGDDVKKGKPDPEIFLLAARRLGIPAGRCIVIEDATAGVEAAKAAGMKCIAVTNTHPREALAKADLVTDNLEKITGEDLHRLFTAP